MSVLTNYQTLQQKIAAKAIACGRDPTTIKLLVVTKNHSWQEASPLVDIGCRDFGENRVQEALAKQAQAPELLNWHLIGHLQKNKVRQVMGKFQLIHSVDSLPLAQKMSAVSQEMGIETSVLLEINTSGEASKYGLTPAEFQRDFDAFLALPGLAIRGLMTMAPFTADESRIRACFRLLRSLRVEGQKKAQRVPFQELSMGMSNDYLIAIEEGATILRLGTAIYEAAPV